MAGRKGLQMQSELNRPAMLEAAHGSASVLELGHSNSKDAHCLSCGFEMVGGRYVGLCPKCGSDRWYRTRLNKQPKARAAVALQPDCSADGHKQPISDCCKATAQCEENRKWRDGDLVCVGTYYVCNKCRMACDVEWVSPQNTPSERHKQD